MCMSVYLLVCLSYLYLSILSLEPYGPKFSPKYSVDWSAAVIQISYIQACITHTVVKHKIVNLRHGFIIKFKNAKTAKKNREYFTML